MYRQQFCWSYAVKYAIRTLALQVARLQSRYDSEGLPFPEAASAISMAAPLDPKPAPAAQTQLSSAAVDLLKVAEARVSALQITLTER